MAGEPQLQQGENDADWVRYLQETLIAWGYAPGNVDGDFGPKTDAAVRAYQADNADVEGNQLVVDGIVGPKTWGALTRGAGAYQADDAGRGEAFSVDHSVSLVMQATDNTCWAASSAMLLGKGESDVIGMVGDAGGDGANEPEMQVFTEALGLEIVAPSSMMPEGWAQLLNRPGHGRDPLPLHRRRRHRVRRHLRRHAVAHLRPGLGRAVGRLPGHREPVRDRRRRRGEPHPEALTRSGSGERGPTVL
jgi:hypothetical protein